MTHKVELHLDFPYPVAKVFADLSDHDNLGRILGAPMKHIKDGRGEGGKSGLGSMRRIGPRLGGLEETIVTYEKDRLIEYRVTKGVGVKNHLGRLVFKETPSGTHLDYVITFDNTIPCTGGLIRGLLQTSISKGLRKYAKR